MIEEVFNSLEENPIVFGFILVAIGLIILLFRLDKKDSFKMKDHGLISWRLLVQIWSLIIMFILMGLIMIFKNI